MMKKLKQIGLLMLMGISIVMFNGCAKDGATGPAGIAGTNGNANVNGSTSVTASNWTLNSGVLYSTTLTWTPITQAIVDKGIVMVYEGDGSNGWVALPYTSVNESRYFNFDVGFVNIYITNTDGSAPTNPGAQTYRIVVIPASNLIAHPNVDFKNYQVVKATFGLKD